MLSISIDAQTPLSLGSLSIANPGFFGLSVDRGALLRASFLSHADRFPMQHKNVAALGLSDTDPCPHSEGMEKQVATDGLLTLVHL